MRYISTKIPDEETRGVFQGHNKKVLVRLDENYNPTPLGDTYYFKYDVEKELKGNMQKRFASGFCTFLTKKYGGNYVEDIPGEAELYATSKSNTSTMLRGVFSKSYKNDYHIYETFNLDDILKPRSEEKFKYDNESRVFASVERTMERLKTYLEEKIASEKDSDNKDFSPYLCLDSLEKDLNIIREKLVGDVVMLDYLFLSNDRHTNNIEFSIVFHDDHTFHIELSPIYDNDRSFGLDKSEKAILDSCSSKHKRKAYTNIVADLKYVIRQRDADGATAQETLYSNDYYSDIISEYIHNECIDDDGNFDEDLLNQNYVYNLYKNYSNIDIRSEFYEFLSELIGRPNFYNAENSNAEEFNISEEETNFLEEFNELTSSSIRPCHVQELVENFTLRQNLLNKSMEAALPTMNSNTPTK